MRIPEFDENAGLPDYKYVQIANHIALRIEAGDLPPRARITESELAEGYGVNKMTIRNTLRLLRERGLIRTLPGKGSFVLPQDSSTPHRRGEDESAAVPDEQ